MRKILNFIYNNDFDTNYSKLFSNVIIGGTLINIISIFPDIFIFYSKNGLGSDYLVNKLITDEKITINFIIKFLTSLNISYKNAFISIFVVYIISLMMSFLGYFRFLFSIIIALLHNIILNSSPITTYGVDYMITFLLYINIFWSLKTLISDDSFKLFFSFTIKLMQVQLCIIYLFGGIGKFLGFDWFDGNSIWLTMNLYMNDSLLDIITPYIPKITYKFISLFILFSELFFPFLVFNKKTKKWAILNVILLHIGISFIIGLHTFSACMIVFNLIAFYPNEVGKYFTLFLNKTTFILTNRLINKL